MHLNICMCFNGNGFSFVKILVPWPFENKSSTLV